MAINKVMVLGAGTMGMGIAQVFAEAGKTVIVRDIADAFIQRGEGVLKKNMEKKVAKGKITEEQKNETLGRVSWPTPRTATWSLRLPSRSWTSRRASSRNWTRSASPRPSWLPTPLPSPSPPSLPLPSVLSRFWACTSSTPLPL